MGDANTFTINTEVAIAAKISMFRQIMEEIVRDMSGQHVSDEEADIFYHWINSVHETAQIVIQCYTNYLKYRDGALEKANKLMPIAYKQLLLQLVYRWFPAIFAALDDEIARPQRFFKLMYKKMAFEGVSKLDELEKGYQRVGDAFFDPGYTDSPLEWGEFKHSGVH